MLDRPTLEKSPRSRRSSGRLSQKITVSQKFQDFRDTRTSAVSETAFYGASKGKKTNSEDNAYKDGTYEDLENTYSKRMNGTVDLTGRTESKKAKKNPRLVESLDDFIIPSLFPETNEVLFKYPQGDVFAITIREHDLHRLSPGEFLNDTVIEFCIK